MKKLITDEITDVLRFSLFSRAGLSHLYLSDSATSPQRGERLS